MNKLLYETEINEHSPIGRVTFEYAQDVTFDEIFEIFRQMALCMGFAEETVKKYFEPEQFILATDGGNLSQDELTNCDDKIFTDELGNRTRWDGKKFVPSNNLNKPLHVDKNDIS